MLSLCSSNLRRNTTADTANITKATAEAAVTIFNVFPIGDSNNNATEMIKMAPVKPVPKIEIANTLFI